MEEVIDNKYFDWLCAKVVERNNRTARALLEVLYNTEFIWTIPGDRHRLEDGLELREDFQRESFSPRNVLLALDRPCSIFETLIAFAQRASFQTDGPVKDWFWEFITNLRLDHFIRIRQSDIPVIQEVLNNFVWRLYEKNGYGGLFPLRESHEDQTQVEIWYQFCAYLDDRGLF